MNNLQIFKNEEFGERTCFELLALALNADDEEISWKIMNLASQIFHPLGDDVFNSLYGAVAMEITHQNIKDEFYYQDVFKRNYSKIRIGEVVSRKNDGRNIPDAWVRKINFFLPVEVKLNKFDGKALEQLQRYMKVYHCENGIAVAKTCTVSLPQNIEFISLKELCEVEKCKN